MFFKVKVRQMHHLRFVRINEGYTNPDTLLTQLQVREGVCGGDQFCRFTSSIHGRPHEDVT